MSRRRPSRSQHRHLERTEVVADQVDAAAAERGSVGPCPGPCNARHRRQADRFVDEHLAALGRLARLARVTAEQTLVDRGVDPTAAAVDGVMATLWEEVMASADRAAAEAVRVPAPRAGLPVWCHRCAADARVAVHNLPKLVGWVIDLGAASVPNRLVAGKRVPVTDPPRVVAVVPAGPGEAVETLECGHRRTVPFGPPPDPGGRQCRTCVAAALVPEPGRLAPAPAKAQGSSSSGRPPVSPAGSPVWVEAEVAVQWATEAAATAARMLGHAPRKLNRYGTSAFRFRELSAACRYLEQWLDRLLLLEHGMPSRLVEGLLVADRLRRVGGMDELVHRLDAACPVCDRRALQRPDGGDLIQCQHCRATWDEHHYQLLVRTQHFEVTNADESPAPASGA